MNLEQYTKDAYRTVSQNIHVDKVGISDLISTMSQYELYGTIMDDQKKALFYGKYDFLPNGDEDCTEVVNKIDNDTLHGIMGIATESTELVQLLLKTLAYNDKFDRVNLSEEIGDIMWYIALLCTANDLSLENIMQQNIDKLKLRYPEKFTEEHANIRDLKKERKFLEQTT